MVEEYQIIPIAIEQDNNYPNGRVLLVTGRAQNFKMISLLEDLIGYPIQLKKSDDLNVSTAIKFYYDVDIDKNLNDDFKKVEDDEDSDDDDDQNDPLALSPIQTKVENIIRAALSKRASDIHLKPHENGSFVLFRIDGRLINFSKDYIISKREKSRVINIIKNMCEPPLDPNNKFISHGGSFKRKWNDRSIDFRVSTMPTICDEKVVIRLLDTSQVPLDIACLGFFKEDIELINRVLKTPTGLFIVSGPTGSGKSTTLHSVVKVFNGLENNTITIEDPVEYRNEELTQVQIRETDTEKLTLNGPKILKVGLRQDPDNFIYNEVRTDEDAQITIRTAITGHRVLTTVHARDCISTLDRLFEMDIKRMSLLRELNCIVAQRLVGLNCLKCVQPYTPTDDEMTLLTDIEKVSILASSLKKGVGCPSCDGGIHGRTVVAEVLVFDNQLRDFLRQDRGIVEILGEIRSTREFKTLWEKGLLLVMDGQISLSELTRVINPNA